MAENATAAAEPFADRADIGVIGLDILDPPSIRDALAARGEELLAERIVPGIIVPLREALLSGNG